MRLRQVPLLAFTIVTVWVAAVSAHHSTAGVYDESQVVSVQGVVTEFRFVNPHAMMSVDVTDDAGKVTRWTVELAGRLNLSEGGWTDQSLRTGESVTVTGSRSRANTPRMLFRRLVRSDGTELLPLGPQRINAIEEERRRRARERTQQP
jgi:hypothetical protein